MRITRYAVAVRRADRIEILSTSFAERHGIKFEVREMEFADRTEALIWIYRNQRNRRNLKESQRAMLAARMEPLFAERAKARQVRKPDSVSANLQKQPEVHAAAEAGSNRQYVHDAAKLKDEALPGRGYA